MARSGTTSWDKGEIEGNKHHIGDNLECSRQSGTEGDMARSGTTSWDRGGIWPGQGQPPGYRGEIEWNKHHIGDNLECSRQSDMCKMRIVDRIFSMAITVLGIVYCSPWKIM